MIKKESIKSDVYSVEGLRALFREIVDLLNDNKTRGLNLQAVVKSPLKSNPQCRYLYGVVYPAIQRRWAEDGNDHSIDYIDLFFKDMFLYEYIDGRKVILKKRGITQLKMMNYIESVREWSNENLGLYIEPAPLVVKMGDKNIGPK